MTWFLIIYFNYSSIENGDCQLGDECSACVAPEERKRRSVEDCEESCSAEETQCIESGKILINCIVLNKICLTQIIYERAGRKEKS